MFGVLEWPKLGHLALFHVISAPPEADSGLFSWQWQGSTREEVYKGLLRPRLKTGTPSTLLHATGQSKSQDQPRFKKWGERHCLLMGGAAISNYKKAQIHTGVGNGDHFNNQHTTLPHKSSNISYYVYICELHSCILGVSN